MVIFQQRRWVTNISKSLVIGYPCPRVPSHVIYAWPHYWQFALIFYGRPCDRSHSFIDLNGIYKIGTCLLVAFLVFGFYGLEPGPSQSPFGAIWRSRCLSRHKPETRLSGIFGNLQGSSRYDRVARSVASVAECSVAAKPLTSLKTHNAFSFLCASPSLPCPCSRNANPTRNSPLQRLVIPLHPPIAMNHRECFTKWN